MGIPNHSKLVKHNKFIRHNKKTGVYSNNRKLLKRFGRPRKYRYLTIINADFDMMHRRNIKNGFIAKKGRIVCL